jgi:hypothetical protein
MSKNTNTQSKALKGNFFSGSADFSSLSASSFKLPADAISSLLNGVILDNVFITNSQIDNSIIGQAGNNSGIFTTLKTTSDVTFESIDGLKNVTWDPLNSILNINGDFGVTGCATISNISICKNTISAINNNGNVVVKPNALGTLYLTGPINNTVSSFGNFYTNLANGNVTFIASDYISLTSNTSYLNASSFSDQNFNTVNGNYSINTDSSLTLKNITSVVENTNANVVVTTLQASNLRVGDTVTLYGTNTSYANTSTINGSYIVSSIIDSNNFTISTGNIISGIGATSGTILKTANNSINLNASKYVRIPDNIPLTFGDTSLKNLNSITGNSDGFSINAKGNIIITNPDVNASFGNYIIQIPQYSKFQYGTSGNNNINFDGNSLNLNSFNNININGIASYINTPDVYFTDPNPLIGNYTILNNDLSDRGIQFRYSDTSGNMKLGWFGYKQGTQKFTFLTNAVNNEEIITGDSGVFDIGSISVTNLTFNTGGILDMACGTIANVKLITGCSGIINISGSQNVNISTSNRLALMSGGDIFIPTNIPLTFGTTGTIIKEGTSGNLLLNANKNIRLVTQTNGSVILLTGSKLTFDGTSVGNQSIISDTLGNLIISTNKNLILNETGGNIVLPQNNSLNYTQSSLQFGSDLSSTQVISGNTFGINLISNSSFGTLNFIASSNVNISNSYGNILLNSINGDINLYANNGNTRILPLQRLIFNNITGNTSNSLRTNTSGTFMIYGPGTGGNSNNTSSGNTIEFKNSLNINLNVVSSGNVNIPTNVLLNIGKNTDGNYTGIYITSDTSNNLNLTNNRVNGNFNTAITNNINISSSNFNVINSGITNLSTQNLIITGTIGSLATINSNDISFYDPNPLISNYTSSLSDLSDRGIQYRYMNTQGNMKTGWFGWKQSLNRFTFYSDAILSANEVISGTQGQFSIDSVIVTSNISFLNTGNIDMNCGTISNLNTIIGCRGVVNINATNSINASAANILLSTNKLQLPYTTPIAFGNTQNSISVDTVGNMTFTANNGSGQLILNGNVQINGTTENVYSTVTNIQDPTISLGGVSGPITNDTYDRGIEFKWYNNNVQLGSIGSVIGFFGFQNSSGRFEYIPNAYNINNVYYGSFGNIQFGNGYFNNLDVNCGTISNVSLISSCGATGLLNINATNGINISTSNMTLPFNSKLNFGNSQNSLSSTSSGNLNITSLVNTNVTSLSGGINLVTPTNGNGYVDISANTGLNFGSGSSGSTIIQNTLGTLNVINSSGNINLIPNLNTINGSLGSISIPTNTSIIFSGTNSNNRISSDGAQLNLYGYSSVGINSSTVTITGNVNIIGSISALSVASDVNQYILPLGTSQISTITSITNTSTLGNILVTTLDNNYLKSGDSVTIKNTDSVPIITGTYIIVSSSSTKSFVITATTLSSPGSIGSIKSNLTFYQGKDVGIAVDYWSTVGNTSITAGTANYKTGFFGWQNTSQTWVFYNQATISNDTVTGSSYGNVQINELYANKISGNISGGSIALDSALQGGSFIISGTNFQVQGGSIDSTPIGTNIAQNGRFTSLSSSISTNLTNLTLQSTLQYSIDRYTLSSLVQTRNPNLNTIVSYVSVSGTTFAGYGTMGSTSLVDGQVKKIIMSSIGPGCSYTLFFGLNKIIGPNPLGGSPKQIMFRRQGQSCEVIWDATVSSWILQGGNAFLS